MNVMYDHKSFHGCTTLLGILVFTIITVFRAVLSKCGKYDESIVVRYEMGNFVISRNFIP